VLRSNLSVLRHIPMHLSRIAEQLATLPLLGEGTRLFATQANALLPVDRIEFAVRLGDEHRVAIVEPGDPTPLADRPQQALGGTLVGQVIRGEVPYLLTDEDGGMGPVSILVVPLRVAGTILGALAMTAISAATFTRTDMAVAQQLGDLIAPHLEVLRRATLAPPAFTPGWKRTPRF
jgi:GAF domain-containing protein